jgi:hypothetical protein
MQKGRDERQQISGHLLISLRCRVDSVVLHAAGNAVNVLEQEGKQWQMVLLGERRIGLVELPDIVRSVVGRQRDAAEHNLDARLLQRRDDLVKVATRALDRKAAKPIVATESDNDENGPQSKHVIQPVQTIFRCVAADSSVHNVILKALRVEVFFQKIGIAVAGISPVSSCEAISESDNDGTRVGLLRCRGSRASRRRRFGRRSRLPFAAGDCNHESNAAAKLHAGTAGAHHTFNLAERHIYDGAGDEGAA